MAVLQRLEQQPRGEAGLADAGRADEHDVLGLGDELELGERPDLTLVDAGLALERERLEGPLLGDPGALDAPGERGLLVGLPAEFTPWRSPKPVHRDRRNRGMAITETGSSRSVVRPIRPDLT